MTEKPKNDSSKSSLLFIFVIVAIAGAIGLAVLASQIVGRQGTGPVANATLTDFTGITAIEPAQEVANFTLTDQNGDPMSLSDMRGKPTLLFFGFTHCPDLCPTTLIEYREIYEAIGEDRVNFVFVSVDGERDTPEVIKAYLEKQQVPYVIGLTGDLETVLQAGAPFGLVAEQGPKDEAGNYDMIHTSSIFFINREGQLVAKYAYGTLIDEIIKDVEARL
jgi:protein SCO1